jgi:hypothetical protein
MLRNKNAGMGVSAGKIIQASNKISFIRTMAICRRKFYQSDERYSG